MKLEFSQYIVMVRNKNKRENLSFLIYNRNALLSKRTELQFCFKPKAPNFVFYNARITSC